MASYRKRGGVWHIQIRHQGYPALTKTFNAKTDADRWVRGVERGLDLGHVSFNNDTPKATYLCDVLARYRDNVSINKRGHDVEKWRLNAISQHWPTHCTESRIVLLLSIVKLSCNNYVNDCAITNRHQLMG